MCVRIPGLRGSGAKAWGFAACLAVCFQLSARADDGLLTIDDFLARERLHGRSPLAATRDGRYLAVTISGSHEEAGAPEQLLTPQGVSPENAGAAVVLIDFESGRETRPFERASDTDHTSFTPVFSPDGRRLVAFVRAGRRHLCPAVLDLESGEVALFEDAPAEAVTAWSLPEWLPDGSGLVFQMPPAERVSEPDALGVSIQRHGVPTAASDPPGADSWLSRLALLKPTTGETRVLYSGFVSTWRIAPDGRSVAANVMRAPGLGERVPFSELILIDLDTGGVRELGEIPRTTWGPEISISPDGAWLGWTGEGAAGRIHLVSGSSHIVPGVWRDVPPGWTGDGVMLLPGADGLYRVYPPRDGEAGELEVRRWIDSGSNPGWATAGRRSPPPETRDGHLWLVHANGADRIDLDQGTVAARLEARLGEKRVAADRAIFSQRGDRIERLDLRTGEVDRVFTVRGLPRHRAAVRRTLEWTLPDGRPAGGHLFLPPGHDGERVPVVVDVYPGTGMRNSAFIEPQLLAAAGYGVFLPQIPVPVRTELMRGIQTGVDAAIEALLESGVADEDRLAIQGQSFGVFAVFSVLVGEGAGRFRAAVACNGTMDLLLTHQLGAHWWVERGQGGMAATPWENPERYRENAPYWRLERVACPVLLIQGEADASGPMMQTAYESLRRLDKPVEFRVYEGSGHAPSGWPASQHRELMTRVMEWYADHLGPPGVILRRNRRP